MQVLPLSAALFRGTRPMAINPRLSTYRIPMQIGETTGSKSVI